METDLVRQRLVNKAHIFDPRAERCSRCGSDVMEALNSPLRCTGQTLTQQEAKYPTTLTAALNSAEDYIVARRVMAKPETEPPDPRLKLDRQHS
jgi:hypothetical protein